MPIQWDTPQGNSRFAFDTIEYENATSSGNHICKMAILILLSYCDNIPRNNYETNENTKFLEPYNTVPLCFLLWRGLEWINH